MVIFDRPLTADLWDQHSLVSGAGYVSAILETSCVLKIKEPDPDQYSSLLHIKLRILPPCGTILDTFYLLWKTKD